MDVQQLLLYVSVAGVYAYRRKVTLLWGSLLNN